MVNAAVAWPARTHEVLERIGEARPLQERLEVTDDYVLRVEGFPSSGGEHEAVFPPLRSGLKLL
jgi:hypothetical protein